MKAKQKCLRILLTGGGTGGHIYPALALAEAIQNLCPKQQSPNPKSSGDGEPYTYKAELVGSQSGLEKKIFPKYDFPFYLLRMGKWSQHKGGWKGLWGKSLTLYFLFFAVLRCFWILFQKRPHVVLGTGGYASFPLLWTACLCGFKTALWEANVVPGLANRYLMGKVQTVYLHFAETQKHFPLKPKQRVKVVGFPLRKEMETLVPPSFPKEKNHFCILVLGGSQGASPINDAVLELWKRHGLDMEGITMVHQTGGKGLPKGFKNLQGCFRFCP